MCANSIAFMRDFSLNLAAEGAIKSPFSKVLAANEDYGGGVDISSKFILL